MEKLHSLEQFCDMQGLEKIMLDWSRITHMGIHLEDLEHNAILGPFNFKEYCRIITSCPTALDRCRKKPFQTENLERCHAGIIDFQEPVRLPDGTVLAYILCGQARCGDTEEPDYREVAGQYGLDPAALKAAYYELPLKTFQELEAARGLLRDAVAHFVEKSYRDWLEKTKSSTEQILAEVTQILYGYNLVLDLDSGKYKVIEGAGSEKKVEVMRWTDDYEELFDIAKTGIPEEYYQYFQPLCLESLRAEKRTGYISTLVYPVLYKNSTEYRWYEDNIFLSVNTDGRRVVNCLGRDVTEQRKQQEKRENELRAVAARDQMLSDITRMLYSYNITVSLETGKYTFIKGKGMANIVNLLSQNDDYETVFRIVGEHIGKDYYEQYADLLSLDSFRHYAGTVGFIGTVEMPEITPVEGEYIWHQVNLFSGYDDEGSPVVIVLGRDVTDLHEKANAMAQLEIANRASQAKSAFMFNMSHDIRTPMNAIMGFTELLEKNLEDKDRCREYLRKIKHSNSLLLSIINNVLEMARIEKGIVDLDLTCRESARFNEDIRAVISDMMKQKGISFTQEIILENKYVFCDALKLREVFVNILSNAYKYTNPGGSVHMRLEEVPSNIEGFAMYRTTISDTGIGMSEEFLPHIFEEFAREHNSTEAKVEGTGLGMSIVKKLLDLMHGRIEVTSELGKGTTFVITIPHRIASAADLAEAGEGTASEAVFEGRRILLAEDNELNAEIAIEILQTAGFVVEHADDGDVCVDMLKNKPAGYYDIILMDIQMPRMNGYEATRAIRALADKEKAGTPIVAMTANAFEEDRQAAIKSGMNDHVAKPIIIPNLMSAISKQIK